MLCPFHTFPRSLPRLRLRYGVVLGVGITELP
jgi:hypothetical protein